MKKTKVKAYTLSPERTELLDNLFFLYQMLDDSMDELSDGYIGEMRAYSEAAVAAKQNGQDPGLIPIPQETRMIQLPSYTNLAMLSTPFYQEFLEAMGQLRQATSDEAAEAAIARMQQATETHMGTMHNAVVTLQNALQDLLLYSQEDEQDRYIYLEMTDEVLETLGSIQQRVEELRDPSLLILRSPQRDPEEFPAARFLPLNVLESQYLDIEQSLRTLCYDAVSRRRQHVQETILWQRDPELKPAPKEPKPTFLEKLPSFHTIMAVYNGYENLESGLPPFRHLREDLFALTSATNLNDEQQPDQSSSQQLRKDFSSLAKTKGKNQKPDLLNNLNLLIDDGTAIFKKLSTALKALESEAMEEIHRKDAASKTGRQHVLEDYFNARTINELVEKVEEAQGTLRRLPIYFPIPKTIHRS